MDYTQFIRSQIDSYLTSHPEEASRLSRFLIQLTQSGDIFDRKNMAGHMTGSAIVLNTENTAALFIKHKSFNRWQQPGGHCEQPIDPWITALREIEEETGITNISLHPWHKTHPHPFDINTLPVPARPQKGETDHVHHDFLYLTQAPSTVKIVHNATETDGAKWFSFNEIPLFEDARTRELLPKILRALIC